MTADNLQLRCRAHNVYEAERWFGVGEADVVRERGEPWGQPANWRTGGLANESIQLVGTGSAGRSLSLAWDVSSSA
jgi:hypothetical protein